MANTNDTKALLAKLNALIGGGSDMNEDAEVVYKGTAIVLPEGMTEKEAITALDRRWRQNEMAVQVMEAIPGYPLDALLALQRAMKETYGWTSLQPQRGFWGPVPPRMVSIPVDADGTTVQVPWGEMTIPGVEGSLEPSVHFDEHQQPQLVLTGEVKKRSLPKVSALAALARKEVREHSIYKGKAVRVEFPDFNEVNFDPQVHHPQFLNLNGVTKGDLIYREEVEWAVQTSIFTPIENIERLREMRTPFRSGVLVSGEYGVGKTLLANVAAKLCEQNGVTFIYLSKTSDIAQARAFAKLYEPAVIFAEDVDSVLAGDDRDEDVNAILNVIDGVEGKHDEVMVIFSTNHPEKINRALLRPGRMDAVIKIEPPDAKAAARLVKMYAHGTLDPSADLTEVSRLLEGHIPAAIREVVERAKKAALFAVPKGKKVVISERDLLLAAKSMQSHLAMLKEKPVKPVTDRVAAAIALGKSLGETLKQQQSSNGGNGTTVFPRAA